MQIHMLDQINTEIVDWCISNLNTWNISFQIQLIGGILHFNQSFNWWITCILSNVYRRVVLIMHYAFSSLEWKFMSTFLFVVITYTALF